MARTAKANVNNAAQPGTGNDLATLLAAMLNKGQDPITELQAQAQAAKRQQMVDNGGVITIGINKNVKNLNGSVIGYFVKHEGVVLTGNGNSTLDSVFEKYPALPTSLDVNILGVGPSFMDELEQARAEYGDGAISVEIHVKQARIYKSNPQDGESVARLEVAGSIIEWGGTLRRPQEDINPLDMDDLVNAAIDRQTKGIQNWRQQRAAAQAEADQAMEAGVNAAAEVQSLA